MRSLDFIMKDFVRGMRALCEKRDNPSLLQTACFAVHYASNMDYDLPSKVDYSWVEARRIDRGRYQLAAILREECKAFPWKVSAEYEERRSVEIHGEKVFVLSLSQARQALQDWENRKFTERKRLARSPERTPCHFSRWGAPKAQAV